MTKQIKANEYTVSSIMTNNPKLGVEDATIAVADNGMWWWKNAVHIRNYLGEGSHWWFTDQTKDTYSLDIFANIRLVPIPVDIPLPGKWHKVSYNSKRPDIEKIEYKPGVTD